MWLFVLSLHGMANGPACLTASWYLSLRSSTFQPLSSSSPTPTDKQSPDHHCSSTLAFLLPGKMRLPHLYWFLSVSVKVTAWDSMILTTLAKTGLHTHSNYSMCFNSAIPTWRYSCTYLVTAACTRMKVGTMWGLGLHLSSSSLAFSKPKGTA